VAYESNERLRGRAAAIYVFDPTNPRGGLPMSGHSHKLGIADDEAVQILLDKLLVGGSHQERREKLLRALNEASKR